MWEGKGAGGCRGSAAGRLPELGTLARFLHSTPPHLPRTAGAGRSVPTGSASVVWGASVAASIRTRAFGPAGASASPPCTWSLSSGSVEATHTCPRVPPDRTPGRCALATPAPNRRCGGARPERGAGRVAPTIAVSAESRGKSRCRGVPLNTPTEGRGRCSAPRANARHRLGTGSRTELGYDGCPGCRREWDAVSRANPRVREKRPTTAVSSMRMDSSGRLGRRLGASL